MQNTGLLRTKRARCDPTRFKLTFINPQLLRNLVDVINGVLTEVSLQVTKKEDGSFEGVIIENLDVRGVCVVIAQMACKVELTDPTSKPRFTLPVETFLTALKQVQSHYTLEISMSTSDADIMILSLDTSAGNATHAKVVAVTKITTLNTKTEKVEFDVMTYKYTVQIKKNDFYSIVKSAKDYTAGHVNMSIYEREVDDVQHILFCLRCKGTSASSDYYFASKVDAGIIRVESEDQVLEDMEFADEHLVVNEHFNTQYILTFLKAMDHKMITLRLSPSKPLICLYGLGAEESFAMFILGGKTEDTD